VPAFLPHLSHGYEPKEVAESGTRLRDLLGLLGRSEFDVLGGLTEDRCESLGEGSRLAYQSDHFSRTCGDLKWFAAGPVDLDLNGVRSGFDIYRQFTILAEPPDLVAID